MEKRDEARNLGAEPPYPGLQTVVFSIRFPEMTAHSATERCSLEEPHLISACGEWLEPVTISEVLRVAESGFVV